MNKPCNRPGCDQVLPRSPWECKVGGKTWVVCSPACVNKLEKISEKISISSLTVKCLHCGGRTPKGEGRCHYCGGLPLDPASQREFDSGIIHNLKLGTMMGEDTVQFHMKCVAGRVLGLVDALVVSETQNAAFKKLIKKEFREQLKRVRNFFHDDDCVTELPRDEAEAIDKLNDL